MLLAFFILKRRVNKPSYYPLLQFNDSLELNDGKLAGKKKSLDYEFNVTIAQNILLLYVPIFSFCFMFFSISYNFFIQA